MNTPSHAVLNLALLSQQPQAFLPIVIGAILPDVPMFVMYGWAKGIQRQTEYQIWTETYWQPHWQTVNHTFHAIPLKVGAIALAHSVGWYPMEWLFVSALLHSLGDLPVHHDDAHRHFLPFTHYRFISPISYWDPRHHGRIVALIEKLLVLIATIYLFPMVDSWVVKGVLLAVNGVYLSGHLYRWITRSCVNAQTSTPLDSDTKATPQSPIP